MRRTLGLVTALVMLLAVGQAAAEMYRWVDENGDVHIATRPEDIPEPYRNRATAITQPGPKPHESCASLPTDPRGGARVPFSIERQHMVVNGCINGRGPFRFMVDTGWAGTSAIRPDVLEGLGISLKDAPVVGIAGVGGATTAKRTRVRSIQIGDAQMGPMEVLAYGLFPKWDGILGADVLNRYVLEIDNRRGVLTLTPR